VGEMMIRSVIPANAGIQEANTDRFNSASGEAGVYRIGAPGTFIRGWHRKGCQPVPLGAITVLRSHSCGALSPVTVLSLYPSVPEAEKR
jgi:hypothetical protein